MSGLSRSQEERLRRSSVAPFLEPIELLRVPVQVGPGPGELRLDFSNEPRRATFRAQCRVEVLARCVDGARVGCAIQATRRCRGPPWLRWLRAGFRPGPWDKPPVACEDELFARCVGAAQEPCTAHAVEFCDAVSQPPQPPQQQQQQQQQSDDN